MLSADTNTRRGHRHVLVGKTQNFEATDFRKPATHNSLKQHLNIRPLHNNDELEIVFVKGCECKGPVSTSTEF